MGDAPLAKPEHLDATTGRAAAIAALVLGILAFVAAAVARDRILESTDWRIGLPGIATTGIAAVVSVLRRERAYPLWLAGLGLAAAALVLGWFLMLALVLGATALVVAILHHVL